MTICELVLCSKHNSTLEFVDLRPTDCVSGVARDLDFPSKRDTT